MELNSQLELGGTVTWQRSQHSMVSQINTTTGALRPEPAVFGPHSQLLGLQTAVGQPHLNRTECPTDCRIGAAVTTEALQLQHTADKCKAGLLQQRMLYHGCTAPTATAAVPLQGAR